MYEVKFHSRETVLKADPYAMEATRYADAHSVVTTVSSKASQNGKTKEQHQGVNNAGATALSILEVRLKDVADIIGSEADYKTMADKLIEYVKATEYTHIQLMSDDSVFSKRDTVMQHQVTMFL